MTVARPGRALLRLRDFRLLGLSTLLSSVGMVGEQVVLGWLVLELTDSPLVVGVALGLRMAPLLLVGIPAGVVADRVDRNRLLQVSGLGMAAACAALGGLALLGTVAVWHLLLLTVAGGGARALNQAAQQSYVHDLAGGARLVGGLALMGVAMRLGGLVGSLLTGALIARSGPGVAYLAVAGGYLLGAAVLLPARRLPHAAAPADGSAWQSVVGFVRVVGRHPALPLLIALTGATEVLGFSHQALLPSLARDVLHVGPQGLGVMTASRSAGGILGLALVAGLGQARGTGSAYLAVLGVFGAAVAALGLAPGFLWVILVLLVANAMGALSDVLSQTLIQLSVPAALRGRAGGAWVVAIGAAPLGQLQMGALAAAVGVGAALSLSGLGLLLVAVAGAVFVPRLRAL